VVCFEGRDPFSSQKLQASFLVLDDVMDRSETRRGQPCWYKVSNVNLDAINDGMILESHIYKLLKKHFGHDLKLHSTIVDLFHEVMCPELSFIQTHTTFESEKRVCRSPTRHSLVKCWISALNLQETSIFPRSPWKSLFLCSSHHSFSNNPFLLQLPPHCHLQDRLLLVLSPSCRCFGLDWRER
jgi:hypothetical protein